MKKELKVIMVEDSEADARLLVLELSRAGYAVNYTRVDTAAELRHALTDRNQQVVLCDFTLPYFSGPEALRIVKDSALDLPFIYVSGTLGEEVAVEAMTAGAHDYVMKTNLKRLAPAIERELREAKVRRQNRSLEADRQQLVEELQVALSEVKRLSGLLSLCAGCKRIRNPDGSWQVIEAYITEHSEAVFSHGLCPECVTRLYPEFANYDTPARP